MELLPAALAAMASYHQFIIYVINPSEKRPGKFDKLPRDHRTGKLVSAHDPQYWTDFNTASAAATRLGNGHGVGFVLTEDDPFWFLDIDNCYDDKNQTWTPIALELCSRLNGCAVEISVSQRGLHIFGSDYLPVGHGTRNSDLGIELYSSGRFVALTGSQAIGDSAFCAGKAIVDVINSYFLTDGSQISKDVNWTDEPCAEWSGPELDETLIERACRSKSAAHVFGGKAAFVDLWEANEDALRHSYPDSTKPEGYDASAADAALAQHLAFWTGKDCERIKRLMLQSGLARSKHEREDYLRRTILYACARVSTVLRTAPAPDAPIVQTQRVAFSDRAALTFLNGEQQKQYFKGCVYVLDQHRVLTPHGVLLKPDQFKVMYSGYTYQCDTTNQRVTRNAFEAFAESQIFEAPRAHTTCFRPDLEYGEIITHEGETAVNIYMKPYVVTAPGDTEPFHLHLEKLLPHDPDGRKRLYYYFCALVQHQGVKFQWCPFIQGVEGNGKTFLSLVVEYAIGARYCHRPRAAEITGRFNGWLYGHTFASIEDMGMGANALEVMEAFKPMVTGGRQEIEVKGGDKIVRNVCINFIINSNHKDGFKKTANDRRIAPFFTAQQSKEDLLLYGMTETYFLNLFKWAKSGGYAAIAHELIHTPIPDEYNPAKGSIRAPLTASTNEAMEAGGTRAEEEILEAIAQEEIGFRGGFVSSHFLEALFERVRLRLSPYRRHAVLADLGYFPHPHLPAGGRTFRNVNPDGRRIRLFVKKGHDSLAQGLSQPAIIELYEKAQA